VVGALNELESFGFQTVPVTVIGSRAIQGFNPKELADALKLRTGAYTRDPAETIPLLGKALDAVQRAVKQLPDDKLEWTAPGRDRPLRDLTHHVFLRVRHTILGISTGVYPPEPKEAARTYTNFRSIADFGEEIIRDYWAWSKRQDLDALRTPSRSPSDESNQFFRGSGAERLDLLAGHTVQHLRQLYWVLEQFGIKPKDQLPDSAFPSEYVLPLISPTGGLF
jgi:hypothetical protein